MFLMEPKLMMAADFFYIPKHNPHKPRGEDAHFICHNEQVIGVADGVGGWAKHGIDAGDYARQLMRNAADSLKNLRFSAADPKSLLFDAFQKTAVAGSSTACIISLDGNRLRAANVGDSGFMVIRDGVTVFRSPVQQFRFNAPYQLGLTADSPEEAEEMVVEVKLGDVVLAATDGLFDNVFQEDIEATVDECLVDGMGPEMVARELARKARRNSLARDVVSPFEVAAYEAGVQHFGGKYDDITVVVTFVIQLGMMFD